MPKGTEASIGDVLSTILSTVFISGINIIISGHILGNALNLSTEGKNHFTLKIPIFFHLGVTGDRAIAGFAAFTVSLLFVGFVLPDFAKTLFIDNMQATDSKWTAVQSLAASLSVICCLLIGAGKSVYVGFRSWRGGSRAETKTPEERVRTLISKEGQDNE